MTAGHYLNTSLGQLASADSRVTVLASSVIVVQHSLLLVLHYLMGADPPALLTPYISMIQIYIYISLFVTEHYRLGFLSNNTQTQLIRDFILAWQHTLVIASALKQST